jgi:hypothetical protein
MQRPFRLLVALLTAGALAVVPITASAAPGAKFRPAYGAVWCCG